MSRIIVHRAWYRSYEVATAEREALQGMVILRGHLNELSAALRRARIKSYDSVLQVENIQ
jgi:hypothetical protein